MPQQITAPARPAILCVALFATVSLLKTFATGAQIHQPTQSPHQSTAPPNPPQPTTAHPCLTPQHSDPLNNSQTALNARYPTVSDLKIRPWHRQVVRTLGSWRYRTGFYDVPYEIKAMLKYISYTRPEQVGL